MATITHGGTLPDSAQKTDFYAIIDNGTVGSIVNADLSGSAGITDANLAQITTANKVATSAITDGALNVAAITCDSVTSAGAVDIAANQGVGLTEGTAPSTAAGQMKIYTKDTSGQPELFVREESDGDEIQMTLGGGTPGGLVQYISATELDVVDLPTVIPFDDSIPTTSEGTKISDLSLTITPTSASNTLVIEGTIPMGATSNTASVAVAVFLNGSANAIAVFSGGQDASARPETVSFRFEPATTDTSARTYDFYGGASTDDATVNGTGDGSARVFGGVSTAYTSIKEISV